MFDLCQNILLHLIQQVGMFELGGKVVLDGEFLWADANRNLSRFPLYDALDDDAQEFFRRRFFIPGGVFQGQTAAPIAFDERFYAMRSGMQGWVSAPSAEIADDLMLARVGVRQRWQTKRGLPGRERIVDWIVLDAGAPKGFAFSNALEILIQP